MGRREQPDPRRQFELACAWFAHPAFHRAWPAVINDETVVESCVSGEELVLLAKVRPAAEARITMRLSDIPGGCRVEMTEVAVSRPLRWVPDSVQLTGVAPRNRECTWRLAMIAEKQDPDAAE
jgi:hypothetical protein